MKRIPCDRECPHRRVGYHAECDSYKRWKAEHEALNQRIRMQKMLDGQSDWMDDVTLYRDRTYVQERDNTRRREQAREESRRREKRKERYAKN